MTPIFFVQICTGFSAASEREGCMSPLTTDIIQLEASDEHQHCRLANLRAHVRSLIRNLVSLMPVVFNRTLNVHYVFTLYPYDLNHFYAPENIILCRPIHRCEQSR